MYYVKRFIVFPHEDEQEELQIRRQLSKTPKESLCDEKEQRLQKEIRVNFLFILEFFLLK